MLSVLSSIRFSAVRAILGRQLARKPARVCAQASGAVNVGPLPLEQAWIDTGMVRPQQNRTGAECIRGGWCPGPYSQHSLHA